MAFRMKNRFNQVVVGEDMQNPIESEVTNIWAEKRNTKGRVLLNGKKYQVVLCGGGIWKLVGVSSMSHVYPEVANKRGVA